MIKYTVWSVNNICLETVQQFICSVMTGFDMIVKIIPNCEQLVTKVTFIDCSNLFEFLSRSALLFYVKHEIQEKLTDLIYLGSMVYFPIVASLYFQIGNLKI